MSIHSEKYRIFWREFNEKYQLDKTIGVQNRKHDKIHQHLITKSGIKYILNHY